MLKFPLPIRAALLDLDGTLLDTIADLAAATNEMRVALDLAPLPEVRVRAFVGKGLAKLVKRALTDDLEGEPDAALFARGEAVFHACYAAVNGRHTTVYPGVREGLEQLRAMGLPLACITNKSARYARPLLVQVGLADFFPLVVGGDTLPQRKPDPAPLLHACRHFGVEPGMALMVGDSHNDVEAAHAAGCPIFCVSYGYSEGVDVRTLGVDAIVDSLIEATALVTMGKIANKAKSLS
ncbi:MAG: phosphoglycolate phosphatase [Burkholderiales bacterium]